MNSSIVCPLCKTSFETEPEECAKCKYPFAKTEKERSIFVAHQVMKKSDIKSTSKHIKNARIILYAIAVIELISVAFTGWDTTTKYIEFIIIGTFFSLGFLVKKNPVSIMTAGLLLYLMMHTLVIMVDLSYLYKGIIIKAIIIVSLIKGIQGVKKAQKFKKESEYLRD